MKKIISICALMLALAIVVTIFAACNKKKEEETTTTEAESKFVASEPQLTIYDDRIVVIYGEDKFQELFLPEGYENEFDIDYAKEHYDFIDMNFDGVPDISLAAYKKGDEIGYYCWIYDNITNSYLLSDSLSALKNISIDSDRKQIVSVTYKNGKEIAKVYSWVDGKLTEQKTYGAEGETVPPSINETIKNNSVGTDKKPSVDVNTTKPNNTVIPSKPAKPSKPTNPSKPNSTTTTKPDNGGTGVTLVEGDFDTGWF